MVPATTNAAKNTAAILLDIIIFVDLGRNNFDDGTL